MKHDQYHRTLCRHVLLGAVLTVVCATNVQAQEPVRPDTSIIFTPSSSSFTTESFYETTEHSWGLDLMLSTNGFGLGGFYRRQFTDAFAGMISFGISDVKDAGETEFVDYYTGQTFVPGKKNRMLMLPLTVSVQYRLFREVIADNFRPYLTAGAGPTMIFVAPYSQRTTVTFPDGTSFSDTEKIDFFDSLKYGKAHYTVGGYVGGGAYFGRQRASVLGVSIRYYFVPFPNGLEILEGTLVKDFGGLYITLHFGSGY